MWLLILACAVIVVIGILEKRRHQKNIDALPVRVNINGIRGKSTVTRLTTGILMEAGYKTVGKTTGTDARMIYWDTPEEKPIKRKPQGPNIGEQKEVMKETVDRGANAIVSECMAVNPDYQIIFQEELLQANIGVIVNVLEDHMDVMGPTLDEIAEAFTATIPYNGHLIITDSEYTDFFKQKAKERNTEVIIADNSKITDEYLRKFEYMVFPDNASLALGVAQALGIDEDTAFRGMLNAPPDPGAMRILPLISPSEPGHFVNGFAANDASSTLNIWKRVKEIGYPTDEPIVIMNCRADRVDRTQQFANDVLPYIEASELILIGETTEPIVKAFEEGKIPADKLHDLEYKSTEEIMEVLKKKMHNRVIYGVGNIHGSAEPLIEKIQEYKVKQLVS
ncbi:poly-gamma-glutamate synthase PgsB [Bacillus atrophaeus]|uniref:Capsular polyglutamate synthetase n=1 Tax=Bacillus atrophaeus (strain 1942) TaxID=720555 RepID=A0ABM5M223_BACA1|nr:MULTISPECIES: poly-gamma-glutamate synthase PgsB [Bacillus]AMR61226.1 poly-gamma-glutamate synthase PgsB [Bacillus subtilis subsp. globigii]MBT2625181.1 poly-gamma-glutamate synthase PgsB [Bacillus sp. ISL-32]BBA91544.1 poly(gamma-glutamic acid) synthase PgsB [Bacillus sp. (in: firmicutes)]ADP34087.1 capsular polyglutamate synthetase [Bacillus atrophaeus 1942]AIK48543.1 poly-gamma-glutamate synthase PgsB [Bacillus atrophaeus subsp. globigii]